MRQGIFSSVDRRFAWMWLVLLVASGSFTMAGIAAAKTSQQSQVNQALQSLEATLPGLMGDQRIDALLQMATAYHSLGRVREAFTALEEAKDLAEQSEEKARLALVLGGISDSYLLSRRLPEALDNAEAGVSIARQVSDPIILATALNFSGNAWMAQQAYAEALKAYKEGVALAKSDPVLTVKLLINVVHTQLASGAAGRSVDTLKSALKKVRDLPASRDKAFDLIALGHLAQRLSDTTPQARKWAYAAFDDARKLAESLQDDRARSYAAGHMAELYSSAQRYREAAQLFSRALFFTGQIDAPELRARWHWQLGRMYRDQNKPALAKASYQQALDGFNSIKYALVFGRRGSPLSFRESVGVVYLEMADILLKEALITPGAKGKQDALREVRRVMESYKSVELENYFQDECVTIQLDKNRFLDVDTLLDPGTATLYPIIFPERTVLLLSLPGGDIKQYEVTVSSEELRRTISLFRRELRPSGNPRRLRYHGRVLYDWLIKSIDQELETHDINTLVVVPDDILRTLPFAALYDGQKFLVDRFALAITPSLTLTDPAVNQSKDDPFVLLNGLSEEVQGFSALPHVKSEVREVASLFDSTQLIDGAFQKTTVQNEFSRRNYSIVSFATHGLFHGDPRQSFLLTYDGKINLDDLESLIRVRQFSDQPVDLMVLSACDTGVGDERAALGLAGVAVKAGVSSALASLWSVNDMSTAQLIPAFFENLKKPGMSKAKALQEAQKKLLADARYQHPFYWGGFVLIGNWF